MKEEEEEEREDEGIEEKRSSPATHRDVSAGGGAWARFEPRLKTDEHIGSAGGVGEGQEGQGGGVVYRIRWGVIPPAEDTPAGGAAVASASASETESWRHATIARGVFCFIWWK
ncbi:hypothetical protein B9Z19DRAFT_1063189 [Tuber borchii]|uniref:Uncharacterized protein n=1 Tax=Tuber borchii TaxID=42251 RepID=A0A2T6ZZ67_TUBBO|nr:hypothetical protein B9Z19DRAFT_1063189 [Tuber borchii]